MNSTVTFPAPAPELKLPRASAEKWQATLNEERRRLQEDQEALRERESNLREYEGRLRAWQAEIDAGRATTARPAAPANPPPAATPSLRPSRAPFNAEDPALQAAWEKVHRARELLEAEQNHLRDDRVAVREQENNLKKREEAVTAREALAEEREALIAAAMPEVVARVAAAEQPESTVMRLTRAPFAMARSVFGGKK
jgi:hypothetical protein